MLEIVYIVEWGDDSPIEYSGPSPSDVAITASHTWYEKGTYTIRAKAKDPHDS